MSQSLVLAEGLDEGEPVEARHHHVADDRVRDGNHPEHRESLLAIGSLINGVGASQGLHQHGADGGVVVDDRYDGSILARHARRRWNVQLDFLVRRVDVSRFLLACHWPHLRPATGPASFQAT